MPIYEYEALSQDKGCQKCARGFETIQSLYERPLVRCPSCGGEVRKIVSRCRAAVVEAGEHHTRIRQRIRAYEKAGMWSHAAELADKHAEKTGDASTKLRAVENYSKAGYDSATLDRHIQSDANSLKEE